MTDYVQKGVMVYVHNQPVFKFKDYQETIVFPMLKCTPCLHLFSGTVCLSAATSTNLQLNIQLQEI